MKYFDDVRRTKIVLYACGIIGISISIVCLLLVYFTEPTSEGTNPSNVDDIIMFLIVLPIFSIDLIGGWLYQKRYRWMWDMVHWTTVVGLIILGGALFIYAFEVMSSYDITLFAVLLYLILCFVVYLKIYGLEIKALFKKWKG